MNGFSSTHRQSSVFDFTSVYIMKRRNHKKRFSPEPDTDARRKSGEEDVVKIRKKSSSQQETPTNKDSDASQKAYEPEDWDESQPYGGKYFLTRIKRSDSIWVKIFQVLIIFVIILMGVYIYYCKEHASFHIERVYAHFGHAEAQHKLAQRYLHGKGVQKDKERAVHWLHKAASKGHPEASYNLAVAHVKGYSKLEPGKISIAAFFTVIRFYYATFTFYLEQAWREISQPTHLPGFFSKIDSITLRRTTGNIAIELDTFMENRENAEYYLRTILVEWKASRKEQTMHLHVFLLHELLLLALLSPAPERPAENDVVQQVVYYAI